MTSVLPEMRLFDSDGQRLYLTESEREKFLKASEEEDRERMMFCQVMHYTGCRPTEALELTPKHISIDEKAIIFRSIKKRKYDSQGRKKEPQYRKIPVPETLIKGLKLCFNLNKKRKTGQLSSLFWTMSRTTAWRLIKKVMKRAGIEGPQATPKGLRHGFAIAMIEGEAPVTLVRDLLGHTDIKTTEIYLQVVGPQKRQLVMNAWRRPAENSRRPAQFNQAAAEWPGDRPKQW